MKKIILILVLACFSFVVNATHLKFMGIPIAGTITAFQSKLQAKGCSLAKMNKLLPSGIRGFNGVFAGKDCEIFVWYNHRTKQVYQVRAIVECESTKEEVDELFSYFKQLLNKKYQGVTITSDMKENAIPEEYKFDMGIYERIEVGATAIGAIELSVINYDDNPTICGVAVTYTDMEGYIQNENSTLNDL